MKYGEKMPPGRGLTIGGGPDHVTRIEIGAASPVTRSGGGDVVRRWEVDADGHLEEVEDVREEAAGGE